MDNAGRFAFVEDGGRLGWLYPDGEVVTIAGWALKANKDPVWIRKSLAVIRQALIECFSIFPAEETCGLSALLQYCTAALPCPSF